MIRTARSGRVRTRIAIAVALAAAITATSTGCSSSTKASSKPTASRPTAAATDTLFRGLTEDVARANRSAFLAKFTGSAKVSATRWWQNMAALGFSNGVFYPDSAISAHVPLNSAGNGTVRVWAGTHDTLDPVDPDSGKVYVPLTSYQLTVHQDSESGPVAITGWKPLMNAPWDLSALYVAKRAHVKIAAYPDERHLADSVAADAEKAAEYDLRMFKKFDSYDVQQAGFVMFVSNNSTRRASWFRTGPQPKGWVADPAGYAKPLPGNPGTLVSGVTTNGIGGARVVFHSQRSSHENTAVLVHEFVHTIFARDTIWSYTDDKPAPAWTAEGVARFVEAFYRNNPDPDADNMAFNFNEMRKNPLRSRFAGRPPTDAQLYNGSGAEGSFWYDVAGSVYGYLAETYSISDALYAARIAYTGNSTPFTGVVKSDKGGSMTFYAPAQIQQAWSKWYRQSY
ncbi:hypothetical protein ACIA58_37420 [Kribbella sp. NPDC051586]|uniref:hypothetical protein n=1 Tax=Kribbella sp. NPDC051586 TaxID=3364118 RepID=UPI0037B9AC99